MVGTSRWEVGLRIQHSLGVSRWEGILRVLGMFGFGTLVWGSP